jgi:pyruvate dehydrogenase E2 component (dihydrolipoamide acetyltransferase)
MPTLIHMPQVSANVRSAVLKEWFKQEGDAVAVNDPLGGVETDKALIDFDAEQAGTLAKILVAAGTDIEVGTPIAVLSAAGESAADVEAFIATIKAKPSVSVAASTPAATAPVAVTASVSNADARIKASPLARRLAKNAGIDLASLAGSGPNGRIVKRDVEQAPACTTNAAMGNAGTAPFVDIPHSSMRRTIARRLTESKSTVPHFYVKLDCRMQALVALRADINGVAPKKVSINDFIIKAVALALQQVPAMNVSWDEAALRQYAQSDISVAVSTDSGLITPIVTSAQSRSISDISMQVADLAARARSGRLAPHEYQGGSFTISNLGMHDVQEFTAIINPPQAAILAVGAVQARPVVVDGGLVAAPMMTMVLSVDHRAVDGALAATFAARLKHLIENPLSLLL